MQMVQPFQLLFFGTNIRDQDFSLSLQNFKTKIEFEMAGANAVQKM
jgi:hypothetical protein